MLCSGIRCMSGSILLLGSFASCVYCSNSSSNDCFGLQCQIAGSGCIFGNSDRRLVYGLRDIFRKNALVDLRCLGMEMTER